MPARRRPRPSPAGPDPADFALATLLARADAEVRRRVDARLASGHGVSLNDLALLVHLRDAPEGRLRRVDLAERVGLTPSGVTRLLGPLERIGLVTREANPADARVALAGLTAAGAQLVEDATVTGAAAAGEVLRWHYTRDELDTLRELLGRLLPYPVEPGDGSPR